MTAAQAAPPKVQGMTRDREADFRTLVERVADRANLQPHVIYGPDNHRYTVQFRRAVWWAMFEGYKMSLASIARCFNGAKGAKTMNHASVRTALYLHVDGEKSCTWDDKLCRWQDGDFFNKIEGRNERHQHNWDLREALQIVAEEWNRINPQNQLDTWKK